LYQKIGHRREGTELRLLAPGVTCMSVPVEKRDLRLMRRMFSDIAPRYDFITRALSLGMDSGWKRRAVERAPLPRGAWVLDLAGGTGDFSLLITRQDAGARPVVADLTPRMLGLARRRGVARTVCADAMRLPFPDRQFDAVFVGYGLRNFPQLEDSLREILRVTKPGGFLVSLDFALPARLLQRRLYLAALYIQGAFWGVCLHGNPGHYTYIAKSLRGFVTSAELTDLLARVGYREVRVTEYVFGGIAVHSAAKRES
jgi:demethylmenaquinone methyltransferase/2-methoxy-6-polyprenyl-1,4-benzoquinol methylase